MQQGTRHGDQIQVQPGVEDLLALLILGSMSPLFTSQAHVEAGEASTHAPRPCHWDGVLAILCGIEPL
jgi:hypothetical protein